MTALIHSIFLLYMFTQSEAIRCLECQHIPFPRDCDQVIECSADEYCYTEQIVTARGLLVYNSGCRAKSRCSAIGVPLVGKRSVNRDRRASEVTTCVECCATSFCNINGCGVPEIPVDQRGPYCFSCDEIADPKACKNVSMCLQNETCDQLSTTLSTKACTASCCRADFCNDRCQTFDNSSLSNETIHTGYNSTTPSVPHTKTVNTLIIPTVAYTQTINTTTIPTVGHTQTVKITTIPSVTQELTVPSSSISPFTTKALLQCLQRDGYILLMDSQTRLCVHIVVHHATWDHARSVCKNEGGDLVVLNTHRKAVLLRHELEKTPEYKSHSSYWIGAKDFPNTNHFHWVNHEKIKESEADWAPGQPDLATQNCVVMAKQLSFRWNNRLCHEYTNYICERGFN